MSKIKVGSQFSGVGAFEQSLIRLGIDFKNVYAADWDKYARQTYLLNFEEPEYYVKDVHDTPIQELTEKHGSLDIAMFSPPCQAFSMAGKRMGKDDQRGILFFNSLEFIKENKPRYFIFENVKGLLSHDKQDKNAVYGRTFQEWINYLGGKSVNGVHTFFPYEDSVPYHIYFQVLNAKNYGIPQNRERVFIIGIRDDKDNDFQFQKPFPLEKRLKDVLESEVDEKYFLSDKMLGYLNNRNENSIFGKGKLKFRDENSVASTLTKSSSSLDISDNILKVGYINQDTQASQVFSEKGTSPNICAGTHGYALGYVETEIGTWRTHEDGKGFRGMKDNLCPTILAIAREDGRGQPVVKIGAFRGRNPENSSDRTTGANLKQTLEINESGTSNALTSVQKDNVVVIGFERTEQAKIKRKESIRKGKDTGNFSDRQLKIKSQDYADTVLANSNPTKEGLIMISSNTSKGFDEAEEEEEDSINFSVPSSKTRRGRVGKKVSQTLDTQCNQGIFTQQRIRRLTPLECFRLMDFNEDMIEKTIGSGLISDSQLYKQAGNSICVGVLAAIISKLKF